MKDGKENKNLAELSDDELDGVSGGVFQPADLALPKTPTDKKAQSKTDPKGAQIPALPRVPTNPSVR